MPGSIIAIGTPSAPQWTTLHWMPEPFKDVMAVCGESWPPFASDDNDYFDAYPNQCRTCAEKKAPDLGAGI